MTGLRSYCTSRVYVEPAGSYDCELARGHTGPHREGLMTWLRGDDDGVPEILTNPNGDPSNGDDFL